mgnify:CR=1 FL=1
MAGASSTSASARATPPARSLPPLGASGSQQEPAATASHHAAGAGASSRPMRRKGRKQKQVSAALAKARSLSLSLSLSLSDRSFIARGLTDAFGRTRRGACTQLWPKTVLRKWLNIRSPESDFSADEGEATGDDDTDSEFEYEGDLDPLPLSTTWASLLQNKNKKKSKPKFAVKLNGSGNAFGFWFNHWSLVSRIDLFVHHNSLEKKSCGPEECIDWFGRWMFLLTTNKDESFDGCFFQLELVQLALSTTVRFWYFRGGKG